MTALHPSPRLSAQGAGASCGLTPAEIAALALADPGARASTVLQAGADFTTESVDVVPGLAGASRWEANVVVPFAATEDTWVVVVARGTDGVSAPMFPVATSDLRSSGNAAVDQLMDGNLDESGVLAMGITNPLFADVDGVAGFRARRAPQ